MHLRRYDEQKSFPVLLEKGKYYYMEALMKEKFNADVLDVAVQTPDNKMHIPITSEYLWTDVENNGKNPSNRASMSSVYIRLNDKPERYFNITCDSIMYFTSFFRLNGL